MMPRLPLGASDRRALLACLAIAAVGMLSPGPARAQYEVGVSAGALFPSSGNPGPAAQVRIGGGPSPEVRLAGELQYKAFEAEIEGLEDVDVHSVDVHFLMNYIFAPEAVVSPYIGGGIGLGINIIDNEALEDYFVAKEAGVLDARASPVVVSVGLFALLGLQVPVGDRVRLFGEGRWGGDWIVSGEVRKDTVIGHRSKDIGANDLGGFRTIAGVRFLF